MFTTQQSSTPGKLVAEKDAVIGQMLCVILIKDLVN